MIQGSTEPTAGASWPPHGWCQAGILPAGTWRENVSFIQIFNEITVGPHKKEHPVSEFAPKVTFCKSIV